MDVVLSRDADSPLTARESTAVMEWLESDYSFHLMRDHPWHCNHPMLGGIILQRDFLISIT